MSNPTIKNENRERLKLTAAQGREIIWGDYPDFKVIQDKIVDNRRWSIDHHIVVQRISDGKYFADCYSRGATESQEESPYEYSEPDFVEVFPVKVEVIDYQ